MKNDIFSKITEEMKLLYEKKNTAYDGAFAKRYAKSGLSYAVNKIGEKCDRLSALERNLILTILARALRTRSLTWQIIV